ncbi:hypothetical protein B0J12DRAFT_29275 [Macrophomina phaseolina]|uniref:Uncharacterized protein n=1 Tax=Macrophomina phaseolina TaxID=35725 RepID=A0ABQ8GVH1_9PEZI|nr:hypothetical protein B0J12DRAFT_29275 [Macrophomina phaseolina]
MSPVLLPAASCSTACTQLGADHNRSRNGGVRGRATSAVDARGWQAPFRRRLSVRRSGGTAAAQRRRRRRQQQQQQHQQQQHAPAPFSHLHASSGSHTYRIAAEWHVSACRGRSRWMSCTVQRTRNTATLCNPNATHDRFNPPPCTEDAAALAGTATGSQGGGKRERAWWWGGKVDASARAPRG